MKTHYNIVNGNVKRDSQVKSVVKLIQRLRYVVLCAQMTHNCTRVAEEENTVKTKLTTKY